MLSTALGFPGDMSLLRFCIGGPRFFPRVATPMTSKRFVKLGIICTLEYYRKYEVKMTSILFKFTIYPSCESALKNASVKSEIVRKSSFNFTFGQGSCTNSDKAVLVQVFLRFEIVIVNNNFVICMMSSFCSMARVASWILAITHQSLLKMNKTPC